MKKRFLYSATISLLVLASCTAPYHFIVTELGYEPVEKTESIIYALPRTGLKVTVEVSKHVLIPGPYADYAQRMLGIEGVHRQRSVNYTIGGISIQESQEPDPGFLLSLSGVEGVVNRNILAWADDHGLIIRGDYNADLQIKSQTMVNQAGVLPFKDVTMEPNVELKQQTIYKTMITDTSFVKVPVTTEQMAMKTLEKKAEEAAKLILEIRSDRYFLAAGLVDPLPAAYDLDAAFKRLDLLEEEYLSLFIGKNYSEQYSYEYFKTPSGSLEGDNVMIDRFSAASGMSAEDGIPVFLVIKPEENVRSMRNLMPQEPEAEAYNYFYYRIPAICQVSVQYNDESLLDKRISIYQAGALVREKSGEK